MRHIYLKVAACAGSSETSISQFDFSLEMPRNHRVNTTFLLGVDDSEDLRSARIAPGDCVQGFIYFEIPVDVDPVHVLYDGLFRDQVKFLAVQSQD